jgi:predicted CoA-binding protein
MKKTVVLGASENPSRYSQMAIQSLQKHGYEVVPVGLKEGKIYGLYILSLKDKTPITDVDTITLYVGPGNQPAWFDYILSLKPKRVILNPGTENPELEQLLKNNGIKFMHACTLVMLSTRQY